MNEIFKDIEGYENYYQVSNLGNVYSCKRRGCVGGILKPAIGNKGYYQVYLFKNGKGKWEKVHRLVAKTFIPNPDNLPQVNHKDEDKTNNRVDNLEWCTNEYNHNYGTRTERATGKLSFPLLQYDLDGNFIKEWPSAREASRKLNLNISGICLCCQNKRNYCGGYKWKYKKAV